jgi:hypothetical protein
MKSNFCESISSRDQDIADPESLLPAGLFDDNSINAETLETFRRFEENSFTKQPKRRK